MMIKRIGLKSLSVVLICISLVGMASASASDDNQASMTTQELTALIKQIDTQNNLQIAATPEVLATINHIRMNEAARANMHMALENIDQHKSYLQAQLKRHDLPADLLALPLLEPNKQHSFSTTTHTLNLLYNRFQNWKLAIIAYKYGEAATNNLIDATGSHDAWEIARAPQTPKDLKKFLALFDASVIIMHNPSLVAGS
ncbi:MAG: hypothetical protein V4501_03865 [Pseudomonadota bacterium]